MPMENNVTSEFLQRRDQRIAIGYHIRTFQVGARVKNRMVVHHSQTQGRLEVLGKESLQAAHASGVKVAPLRGLLVVVIHNSINKHHLSIVPQTQYGKALREKLLAHPLACERESRT